MNGKITRIVATTNNGNVKVQVALPVEDAVKLVSGGFPAYFTAWLPAAEAVVGKVLELLVTGIRAQREDTVDGKAVSYPAETTLSA